MPETDREVPSKQYLVARASAYSSHPNNSRPYSARFLSGHGATSIIHPSIFREEEKENGMVGERSKGFRRRLFGR